MLHPKSELASYRQLGCILVAAVVALGMFGTLPAHAVESITYYHLDASGSPVAATDEQGNLRWREEYKPYGEKIRNEVAAATNDRAYTGHPHDDATGLTYMGARYYDPVAGRFLSIDSAAFTEENIHSFNRYAYGNNNPYMYIDPDGRSPKIPRWLSDWLRNVSLSETLREAGKAVVEELYDRQMKAEGERRIQDHIDIRKQLEIADEILDHQDKIVTNCSNNGGGAGCWERYDRERTDMLSSRERWRQRLRDEYGESYPSRREYLDSRNNPAFAREDQSQERDDVPGLNWDR